MGWFNRKPSQPTQPVLVMEGKPKVGVRGPRFHAEQIIAHLNRQAVDRDSTSSTQAWATFVAQPDNEWIPDAVAVHLDGRHVGHLPDGKLTERGRRLLARADGATLMVSAHISWRKSAGPFEVAVFVPDTLEACDEVSLVPLDEFGQ